MTSSIRTALYFGCLGEKGHYLHLPGCRRAIDTKDVPSLPWSIGHLDTGLLKNGRRSDVYDGQVFWTCGQKHAGPTWHAFYWWDRSVDQRPGSNSGIYVRGFELGTIALNNVFGKALEAFEFGKAAFPAVIGRQHFPLVLQP